MGSGLIYAIIIIAWIAYFVPAWVRRHDEASESKSVERYRSAMRIVSKGTYSEIPITRSERDEARADMFRRRQGAYAVLLLAFIALIGLAALGSVPWFAPIIPLGLTGALAVVIFQHDNSRVHSIKIEAEGLRRPLPQTIIQEPIVQRETINAETSSTVHVRPRTGNYIATTGAAPHQNEWKPVQVPSPTYVNAAKALRPHRTIDLTKPGAWTEAQRAEEAARLAAIAPDRDNVFDQVEAEIAASQDENRRVSGE